MTEHDDELHGVLFKNDKKTNDRQPDYKGEAQVQDTQYWLSAWIRDSKGGTKYMSVAFTAKDDE